MLQIKQLFRNQRGFSLIELMIAVAILALVSFGIFQAFGTSFQSMAEARDRTEAVNYLQEMIENYKNMYFDEIQNKPMSPIPGTKYSQGAIVIPEDKEDEDDNIITLKRVIAQVRWIDRDGAIKTEKASTLIYKKSETSEVGTEAVELVLYAQSYYTILPSTEVTLIAEIRDENGNLYEWNGQINFQVITEPTNVPSIGYLPSEPDCLVVANNGIAQCNYTAEPAEEGDYVEGIERIQATADVDGNILTDTVNIRVTTGPVAILLEPASESDKILAASIDSISTINLTVVKADYEQEADEYSGTINLSAEGPGTLSTNEIVLSGDPTSSFTVTSDGTAGVVEITASAPGLDMGYTEITFYGEPASILVKPQKTSVYPGEHLPITITIVDDNNFLVDYSGSLNLTCSPDYGGFDPNPGTLTGSSMETTFSVDSGAPVGTSITLEAAGNEISGSAVITVISPLTAKYLRLSAKPSSVLLPVGDDGAIPIKAEILDKDWTIVPNYNEMLTFYAKVGGTDFGTFSANNIDPSISGGEVTVDLTSFFSGTVTVTAVSGDLELYPEGGIEVIFYNAADHIELSANPDIIEADGNDTSIITGIIYDITNNRVTNYGENEETVTLSISGSIGELREGYEAEGQSSLIIDEFISGEFSAYFSSAEAGEATIQASASGLDGDSVTIECIGDIQPVVTLVDVVNYDDYRISFDISIANSPLYIRGINIEWSDKNSYLDEIIIYSPSSEVVPNEIPTGGVASPYSNNSIEDTLDTEGVTTIHLYFSNVKINDDDITIKLIDENNIEYLIEFKVPK